MTRLDAAEAVTSEHRPLGPVSRDVPDDAPVSPVEDLLAAHDEAAAWSWNLSHEEPRYRDVTATAAAGVMKHVSEGGLPTAFTHPDRARTLSGMTQRRYREYRRPWGTSPPGSAARATARGPLRTASHTGRAVT